MPETIRENPQGILGNHQTKDLGDSFEVVFTLLEDQYIETKEHTIRMRDNAVIVGKELRLSIIQLCELDLATRLHDIGKIKIPDAILLKPAKLTKDEFEIMKTHSKEGYKMVIGAKGSKNIAKAVLTHHERWDGTGYPLGLKEDKIPLYARIISVVDAFDAMISNRPYQGAVAYKDAIEEIIRCSGSHFDPKVVNAFLKAMNEKGLTYNELKQ